MDPEKLYALESKRVVRTIDEWLVSQKRMLEQLLKEKEKVNSMKDSLSKETFESDWSALYLSEVASTMVNSMTSHLTFVTKYLKEIEAIRSVVSKGGNDIKNLYEKENKVRTYHEDIQWLSVLFMMQTEQMAKMIKAAKGLTGDIDVCMRNVTIMKI